MQNTKDAYDVIVVGGGPAGLSTAIFTAQKGYSVIVLEEHSEIGLPLQCGEYLPTPQEMKDLLPNVPDHDLIFNYPKHVIVNKTRKTQIVGPTNRIYEFELNGYVVNRPLLEKYYLELARKAGAVIKTNSRVSKLTKDGVCLKNGTEIKGAVIVGADGPMSLIAREANLPHYQKSADDFAIGLEYLMEDIDIQPDTVEMYFGSKYAPGGYAWVIPKGPNRANVGFGIRPSYKEKGISIHDLLLRFIRKHPLVANRFSKGKRIKTIIGSIPVGGPLKKTWTDRVIVVGDSAGFVMASNGGGIPTALVGGFAASQAISEFFENGKSLQLYETLWRSYMGKELQDALKIRKIVDLGFRHDRFLGFAMRMVGYKAMNEMVRCRIPGRLKLIGLLV